MLQKILLTIIFITIVWFGFKWLDRVRTLKMGKVEKKVGHSLNDNDNDQIKDMIQCTKCGAYVPADDQHNCE